MVSADGFVRFGTFECDIAGPIFAHHSDFDDLTVRICRILSFLVRMTSGYLLFQRRGDFRHYSNLNMKNINICEFSFELFITKGESKGGRFNFDCTIGFTSITSSGLSVGACFSGSGGLMFECGDKVHPLMLRNSVKSVHFLLQHVQPL